MAHSKQVGVSSRRQLAIVAFGTVLAVGCGRACESSPVVKDAGNPSEVVPPAQTSRVVVLGRRVDLKTMRAEVTLTDSLPERELNSLVRDLSIIELRNGALEAYKISTGTRIWHAQMPAPSVALVLVGEHVYALCNNRVVAYRLSDGSSTTLSISATVRDLIAHGANLLAADDEGRVTVFEAVNNEKLASRVLPELEGSTLDDALVSHPDGAICVVGQSSDPRASALHGIQMPSTFALGCYDRELGSIWRKEVKFDVLPGEAPYQVVQLGPYHLVLEDQPNPGEDTPEVAGRGAIVRWRDGAVTAFSDHVFGTIEDANGDRLTTAPAADAFKAPIEPHWEREAIGVDRAIVRRSASRAYVLIAQGDKATGLSAFDTATGKPLFRTPVPLGASSWQLEIVGGYPIVRTSFIQNVEKTRVTIHDPDTGAVLYQDERTPRS
jgi:hypothetical protein